MLNWIDDHVFELDGIKFTLDVTAGPNRRPSTERNFTLVKTKSYLAEYLSLQGEKFENIVELGVFQGGSIAFLDKLFEPKNLIGVEISPKKVEALESYIKTDASHIKIYYGSSQGDTNLLNSIVENDLAGQLDLVVDDASHLYELTKTSMMALFPLLAPGGTYLIEDWAWSHRPNAQVTGHPWSDKPALTNLIFEMVIELGGATEIEDIYISNNIVRVRKSRNAGSSAILENKSLRNGKLSYI
jgi:predicted O-methyltransferase YrrM